MASRRLGIRAERVVRDLADPELIGPRLDHRQVVEGMAVEDLVDPAPRGIAADRLGGELPSDGERSRVRSRATGPELRWRNIREKPAPSLIEGIEVAAVVVSVGGPRPAVARDRDVL